MRTIKIEAEDQSKGMSHEEVLKAMANPQGIDRHWHSLRAQVTVTGKIRSLTWRENS